MGLQCLGTVAHDAGDYAAAQALLEECVSVSRDIGAWRVAVALSELGDVRHAQGDLEAARSMLLEALAGQRELGDKPGIAKTLIRLAIVSHDGRDIAAARAHLGEALDSVPTGDALSQVTWLDACAGLSLELAGATCAARLWGCTQRLARGDRLADDHAGACPARTPGGRRAQHTARRCRVRARLERGPVVDPGRGAAVRTEGLRSRGAACGRS